MFLFSFFSYFFFFSYLFGEIRVPVQSDYFLDFLGPFPSSKFSCFWGRASQKRTTSCKGIHTLGPFQLHSHPSNFLKLSTKQEITPSTSAVAYSAKVPCCHETKTWEKAERERENKKRETRSLIMAVANKSQMLSRVAPPKLFTSNIGHTHSWWRARRGFKSHVPHKKKPNLKVAAK